MKLTNILLGIIAFNLSVISFMKLIPEANAQVNSKDVIQVDIVSINGSTIPRIYNERSRRFNAILPIDIKQIDGERLYRTNSNKFPFIHVREIEKND